MRRTLATLAGMLFGGMMASPPRVPNSGTSTIQFIAIVVQLGLCYFFAVPALTDVLATLWVLAHGNVGSAVIHVVSAIVLLLTFALTMAIARRIIMPRYHHRFDGFLKHVEWCATMAMNGQRIDAYTYAVIKQDIEIARQYRHEPLTAVYRLKMAGVWIDRPATFQTSS